MPIERRDFWSEVLALSGSVTPLVLTRVLTFGLWSCVIWWIATYTHIDFVLGVAPYEMVGAVMALLLVLRTNSGYDRWYEGRKLWGGIVNQSRNLGIIGAAYGPDDPVWRKDYLRWTAAFPHLARHSLRAERDFDDVSQLLTASELKEIQSANHMPIAGSFKLAQLLQQARRQHEMDDFAFLRAEEQRSLLIDYIGACERIMKTPLAKVMSIKVRRFLFLYLSVLPLAIVDRAGALTPFLTMLVAYPLLSLDQIGVELENPFSARRLSHLPLTQICENIEANVTSLEDQSVDSMKNGWREAPTPSLVRVSEPQTVG